MKAAQKKEMPKQKEKKKVVAMNDAWKKCRSRVPWIRSRVPWIGSSDTKLKAKCVIYF